MNHNPFEVSGCSPTANIRSKSLHGQMIFHGHGSEVNFSTEPASQVRHKSVNKAGQSCVEWEKGTDGGVGELHHEPDGHSGSG